MTMRKSLLAALIAGALSTPVLADDFGLRISYGGGGCYDRVVYYDEPIVYVSRPPVVYYEGPRYYRSYYRPVYHYSYYPRTYYYRSCGPRFYGSVYYR